MDSLIPIISVLSVFVFAPGVVFTFVYFYKKNQRQLEMLKYQKEIKELELEKERIHLKAMEEENRKYDRIIDGHGGR